MNRAQKDPARSCYMAIGLIAGSMLLVSLLATAAAQAQTMTVLHSFTGGADGSSPRAGVALDRAGNVYGVTPYGGSRMGNCGGIGGCGVVYRAAPRNGAWIFTPLYIFQGGEDGAEPWSTVTVGPDGALYGTTLIGGGSGCSNSCGTVFRLAPSAQFCHMALCPWTETIIYHFATDPNGLGLPFGGVIFDAAGNLYGIAGGSANGGCAVYKLSPSGGSWTLSVLYNLQAATDGTLSMATPAMDAAGNLYGTTTFGGANGYGTVFELVHSAGGYTFNLLYTFTGSNDGGDPTAGVAVDAAGNVFGDTAFGGGVFELTRSGSEWNYSVIVPFVGGLEPPISLDSAGNIYGTGNADGTHGLGSVFKLTYSNGVWTHNIIYSFGGGDGGVLPLSSVAFDSNGNLYGTTNYGGSGGAGTVWQLTP